MVYSGEYDVEAVVVAGEAVGVAYGADYLGAAGGG